MIVEAKEPLGEDVILFEGEIEEFGRELWKVTKCREPTIAIEYFYSILKSALFNSFLPKQGRNAVRLLDIRKQ